MTGLVADLEERRARRWWLERGKVRTLARAKEFIDDVGFCLLWPAARISLPALWPVGSDVDERGETPDEWGPDAQRMWGWKDELPRKRMAWYGPFLRGRKGFLSIALLADLYPRAGEPDDFLEAPLSASARRTAQVILASGPTSKAVLREATGMLGKSFAAGFDRTLAELGRALVVTHDGVEEQGAGWPSAVIELTARAFRVRPKGSPEERRARAAQRFVDTVIATKPGELARAFNWETADARAALDGLVASDAAERRGSLFFTLEKVSSKIYRR